MENKPMKLIIIEDDKIDCKNFLICAENRDDIEIVGMTDSDAEGLKLVKIKHPEGIVLDLELNNSLSGSIDSFEFLKALDELENRPIVIVTTHVNSKTTYDILHRNGVDLILYKDHPAYSSEHVFNSFLNFRKHRGANNTLTIKDVIKNDEDKIANIINSELDLIGVTSKLKGRSYIFDAILYLIENDESKITVTQYLTNKYKKSTTTITNGISNAIIHAWRVTAVEDLMKYYTARVNYETGIPTPMEFLYYYSNKIKKMI